MPASVRRYFNHRSKSANPPRIPIIHYTVSPFLSQRDAAPQIPQLTALPRDLPLQEAQGPVVVCVSKRRFSDDLDAELLKNVATLGLTEGHDLWFFI